MPASPDQIGSLRQSLGNLGALRTLAESDPELKSKSEYMSGKVQKQMNTFEQDDMANFILDWHYKGKIPQQETTIGYQQGLSHLNAPITRGRQEEEPYTGFSILKTLGNIPKSGASLIGDVAKGAINIFNPDMEKNTLLNLGKIVLGTAGNSIETVAGALGVQNPEELMNLPGEEMASAVGKFYADRYGGTQNILKTIQDDPVGFLADVATVFTAGGAALKGTSKVAQIGSKAISTTGFAAKTAKAGQTAMQVGTRIDPILGIGRVGKAGMKGMAKIGQFGVSQATGFAPDTLKAIISNPKFQLAESGKITRVKLGEKVVKAINKMESEVSDVGAAYNPIIKGAGRTELPVGWLDDFLSKKGFKIAGKGKKRGVLQTLDTPAQLSDKEMVALNAFYKEHSMTGRLTANQFLNFRRKIAKSLGKFDKTIDTRSLEALGREIYDEVNSVARGKIKGLTELDETFSPQFQELQSFRKEFIDQTTGELKSDALLSRISATNAKTRPKFMAKLERLVPEMNEELNALRAMEDIIGAGERPGRYVSASIRGAGIGGGILTGNPGLILAAVATTPTIALPILKAYGKSARLPASIIRTMARKMNLGRKFTTAENQIMLEAIRLSSISQEENDAQ